MFLRGLKAILLGSLLAVASLISLPGCISRSVDVNVTITRGPQYTPKVIFSEVALPAYKVVCENGSGSAIAIDRRTLVTAAHVVVAGFEDEQFEKPILEKNVFISNKLDGSLFVSPIAIAGVDIKGDFAILKSSLDLPYLANWADVADQDFKLSWLQEVAFAGYTLGLDVQVVTFGHVSSLDQEDRFVMFTAPSAGGNSGGPIYVFHKGSWVVASMCQAGYVVGFGTPVYHMSLGAKTADLYNFVRENH